MNKANFNQVRGSTLLDASGSVPGHLSARAGLLYKAGSLPGERRCYIFSAMMTLATLLFN